MTPPLAPPDCGSATPRNCDTAVFNGLRAEYTVTTNANGTITVQHTAPVKNPFDEGTDTLRNIELLQFADITITAPGVAAPTIVVPNVVGSPLAAAQATLTAAVSATHSRRTRARPSRLAASSARSRRPARACARGTPVALVMSQGTLVPSVVDTSVTAATAALAAANLTISTTTASAIRN